jgi:hypothetical protein
MSFPLIKPITGSRSQLDEWDFLQSLMNRELISMEELIDEIQTCPFCQGGLLNFKNSCPNCQSIDIKAQQFIHCFTCANIAPMDEFLRLEKLICPRCNAKLRHIGIDYDKPLEDKLCNKCAFYFLDAEVNIICLKCLKIHKPENLVTRRLYNYKLSKRGELLALGIEKKIQRQYSHFFKFIDYTLFLAVVKWQTILAKRYDTNYFSILALKIVNEDEILSEVGIYYTEKLLNEFYKRLRNIFRESDLGTQEERFVLFLLPMTDAEGCNVLLKRIKQFSEKQELSKSEKKLVVHLGFITSKDIIQTSQELELQIAELHSQLGDDNG